MGFGNPSPRMFFKVSKGAVVITLKKDSASKALAEQAYKVEERTNKAGAQVIDYLFKEFSGFLQNISLTQDEKFGPQWTVVFKDAGEEYIWNVPQDAMMFQGFLNSLSSAIGRIGCVTLSPYEKASRDGTLRTWIGVRNNGEKLGWKYDMNDLPAVEQIKDSKGKPVLIQGKPAYNKEPIIEWMSERVDEINKSLVGGTVAPVRIEESAQVVEVEENDELPF